MEERSTALSGPTADDRSKAAVANVFGRGLEIDQEHVAWMKERWRTRFGREMPASNMAQAALPVGATKLSNKHGSAPGVFITDDQFRPKRQCAGDTDALPLTAGEHVRE